MHIHKYIQVDQTKKLLYTSKGYWCICGKEKIRYVPTSVLILCTICIISYIVGMFLLFYKTVGGN